MKNAKVNRDKIEILGTKGHPIEKEWVDDAIRLAKLIGKFKGPLQGYKLYYTCKIENNFCEPIYHKMTFKIDTLLLKITSVKDTIIDHNDITWR